MGRTPGDGRADEIEFLTPDARVFGPGDGGAVFVGLDTDDLRAAEGPDDDAEHPRWVSLVAGLVVAAVIAGGVVAASPWDGGTEASTPTTSPRSVIAPIGGDDVTGGDVVPSAPSTGWVFDPLPSGFTVADAWTTSAAGTVAARGWSEVWATADATAVDGRWFSITLLPAPAALMGDGIRVDLGGRTAIVGTADTGRLTLSAPLSQSDTSQSIGITSSGFTVEELTALAASIGIDADRPQLVDDRPVFRDPSLVEGFELVASAPSDEELIDRYAWGASTSSTAYVSGTTDGPTIQIDTAPVDRVLEPLGRLTIGPVRIFPDSASVPADFTGRDLVIGVSPSGSDPAIIARWHTDDAGPPTTITVRTTLPLGELFELLPTLRRTTIDEWRAVRRRVRDAQDAATTGIAAVEPSRQSLVPVASGVVNGRDEWRVSIDPATDFFEIRDPDLVMSLFGDGAPLRVVTSMRATYVIARSDTGGWVRVRFDGDADGTALPPSQPLQQVVATDGTVTTMVAAVAFEGFGPYTIELVGPDGVVVDTLDPLDRSVD